jgi:hypothetical protein
MMLVDRVKEDVREAMRRHDQTALTSLRLLQADFVNEQIAKKHDLTDEEAISVVRRRLKKYDESIRAFRVGSREDQAQREEQEREVIAPYVPAELSDDELRAIVGEVIATRGVTDARAFGQVMKEVMQKVGSRADGARVSDTVRTLLSQSSS